MTIGALCDAGAAELQTGPFGSQLHAHDYVAKGVPVVPTEAIRARRIDHSVLPRISDAKARELIRHRVQAGDILFARRGAQATGQAAYVRAEEDGFICGTGAIRLRLNPEANDVGADFLSHVLTDPASIRWFKAHAIGATMPNLNESIIRAFPLRVPPRIEQRAIASILSMLDDKIELNRRLCDTLGALAQTLFKAWLVDFEPVRAKTAPREPDRAPPLASLFPTRLVTSEFGEIPEGWRIGVLGDVALHPRRGIDHRDIRPDTPYIALEHMPRRSIALGEWASADELESNKFAFRRGEILFGKLRPYFHKVGVAPVDGVCSTDIVVVKPVDECWFGFVLGHLSSAEFVNYANASSTGTKMPRTSWRDMSRFQVVIPPESVARALSDQLRALVNRIVVGIHESRTLAATRDALLPKLLSGELRVKDAERLAAAEL